MIHAEDCPDEESDCVIVEELLNKYHMLFLLFWFGNPQILYILLYITAFWFCYILCPLLLHYSTNIYNETSLGGNADYFPGFDQFSLYFLFTLQGDMLTYKNLTFKRNQTVKRTNYDKIQSLNHLFLYMQNQICKWIFIVWL